MVFKRACALYTVTFMTFGLLACQSSEIEEAAEPSTESPAAASADAAAGSGADTSSASPADAAVVEVTVQEYSFVAPPELRSGWTTFRMTNMGEQPHFMILWRLPAGRTFDDYAAQVAQPFQEQYDPYFAGEVDQAQMLEQVVAALPDWFGDLEGMGGVGLVSPGLTGQATTLLEPGDYVMECYVLNEDGQFHSTMGMLRPLIVNEEDTGMAEPEADVRITLSNYEMNIDGDLTAGEHSIAVHAVEDPEGIILHDVHLALLDADTSIDDLIPWMSWIDGLRPPAPAEFHGGADQVAGGRTGYFTVTLTPGRYALISEGYAAQGMVHEFEVE
jgi:hypothetical protein